MATTSYCGRCLTTFDSNPTGCPNLACGGGRPNEGWGQVLRGGDLLDRHYRVERCLAVGGAGLTYLAQEIDDRENAVGPRVAIKVLYNARASGAFLRRLSTEAQILQELAHENIVQLRGFVHRAGHEPYLVTRFEEGGSLAEHIARVGPVPARVAASILRQILLALDVAHQRGVVHRDLKPDNVLLASRATVEQFPHVRVADFGIAKISGGMVGSNLTRAGAFVGTPEFAAPEQFEGQNPTPATDIFAAGGVLWFMVFGRPPFTFSHRVDITATYEELLEQLPLRPPLDGFDAQEANVLSEVFQGLFVLRPEDRWTVSRVLQGLAPLLELPLLRSGSLEITNPSAPGRHLGPPPAAEPTEEAPRMAADDPPPPPSLDVVPMPRVDDGSLADAPPPPPPERVAADLPPPPPPSMHDFDDAVPTTSEDPALDTQPIEMPTDLPPRRTVNQSTLEPMPGTGETAPPDDDPALPPPLPPSAGVGLGVVAVAAAGAAIGALSAGSRPPPPPASALPPPPPVVPPIAAPPPPPASRTLGGAPMSAAPTVPRTPPPASAAPTATPLPAAPRTPPTPVPAAPRTPVPAAPRVTPPTPVPAAPRTTPAPAASRTSTPSPAQSRAPDPLPVGVATPAPPMFEPSPPPAMPEPAAAGGVGAGTAAAGVAGCFGLSMFGVGAVAVGGAAVVGVVLVAAALALGWFTPSPLRPDPTPVVDVQVPERFRKAPRLANADAQKVQSAATAIAPDLSSRCGRGGTVTADVLVDTTGKVVFANVGRTPGGSIDPSCVKRGFEKHLKVKGGVAAEGTASVSVPLP